MNIQEERFKARRMKTLISRGFYLQDAQKIVSREVEQRRMLYNRLAGRTPVRDNPDFQLCEQYPEE